MSRRFDACVYFYPVSREKEDETMIRVCLDSDVRFFVLPNEESRQKRRGDATSESLQKRWPQLRPLEPFTS